MTDQTRDDQSQFTNQSSYRPTVKIRLFLLICFLLTPNHALNKPKIDKEIGIVTSHEVRHYDCTDRGVEKTQVYSITEVPKCTLEPEDLSRSKMTSVSIYQAITRITTKAIRCQVSHTVLSYKCSRFDYSMMDREAPQGHTTFHRMSGPECENMVKTGIYKFDDNGKPRDIPISTESHTETVTWGQKQEDSKYQCDNHGHVDTHTFTTLLIRAKLNVDVKTGKIFNIYNQELPCKYSEGNCDSTGLEPMAYSWNITKDCELAVIYTGEKGYMYKYLTQYFAILDHSDDPLKLRKDTSPDLKLEVLNEEYEPQRCKHLRQVENRDIWEGFHNPNGSPVPIYQTNIKGLYISYDEGFNLDTGEDKSRNPEDNVEVLAPTENSHAPAWAKQRSYPTIINRTKETDLQKDLVIRNINPETHGKLKSDFLLHKTIHMLRESEVALIRQQCEIKRNLISTILTLALTSDENIGYLLTGDKSKFAETRDGGATIWLYQCEEKLSFLTILPKCYNFIPVNDKGHEKYVHPITRQTFRGRPPLESPCESSDSRYFLLDKKRPNLLVYIRTRT
jgi:hypothetical protein